MIFTITGRLLVKIITLESFYMQIGPGMLTRSM